MDNCTICGHSLPGKAKFCGSCGNATAVPETPMHDAASLENPCRQCGVPISPDAMFCPACGSSVDDTELSTASIVVNNLEQFLTPSGATVLSNRTDKRRGQRLEIGTDGEGLFKPIDRNKLRDMLAKHIYLDSYLASEVTLFNRSVFCVWNAIGGDVFPLTSEHAEAVVLSYESLLPRLTTFEELHEISDAPPLNPEG